MVLHDLILATQYAQRIVILQYGKIQADGSPWLSLRIIIELNNIPS